VLFIHGPNTTFLLSDSCIDCDTISTSVDPDFIDPDYNGWFNELGSWITSLSSIRYGFAPPFVKYKYGALDSQPQVIKFTSCLPMVGGSLRVLRLPQPQDWSPWIS